MVYPDRGRLLTYALWRERFLAAVDQDLYPADWLDRRVASGRARFWGNEAGAIVAEIRQFPSGVREVHGLVAAGSPAAIKALIIEAENWGRSRGCSIASIESRPGWERIMRADGYELSQVRIVKPL